jgi:hypothetical protein
LYFFIGIPASLQSEFSLTPFGAKNPGQATSEDVALAAMAKLDGHKIGHNPNLRRLSGVAQRPLSLQKQKSKVVDVTGIEPATPCLQSRCSPS